MTTETHSSTPRPTLIELYLCFQGIALRSFGGVLPWTRKALVEERGWREPYWLDGFV